MRESVKRKVDYILKILRKNKLYFLAGVTVVLVIALSVFQRPARHEDCSLCAGLKCHAPCIVNLATGQIGELVIYEPHPSLVGEIAEEQPGGFFAFRPCAEMTAVQDADARTCSVQLHGSRKKLNLKYFCDSCCRLLSEVQTNGYAIADLYDLGEIHVYPIEAGAVYTIRNYIVSVDWDDEAKGFNVLNFSPEL